MILNNVKKRIILNAGHHNTDPGAQSNNYIERDVAKRIRDTAHKALLRNGFDVALVPDSMTLSQSIKFANEKAPLLNDALSIDIHLNAATNTLIRGVETYYGTSDIMKRAAETLSASIASLGIANRGAKSDTESQHPSLGWIRQVKSWSLLVECGFITNSDEMSIISRNEYRDVGEAIARGVCEIYGVQYKKPETDNELYIVNSDGKKLYKITKL